jgi:hypothetical protein
VASQCVPSGSPRLWPRWAESGIEIGALASLCVLLDGVMWSMVGFVWSMVHLIDLSIRCCAMMVEVGSRFNSQTHSTYLSRKVCRRSLHRLKTVDNKRRDMKESEKGKGHICILAL